jgi:hypothetical protein
MLQMQRGPESFSDSIQASVEDTHDGAQKFRAKGPGIFPTIV